jgi:hypothetical protein
VKGKNALKGHSTHHQPRVLWLISTTSFNARSLDEGLRQSFRFSHQFAAQVFGFSHRDMHQNATGSPLSRMFHDVE